MEVHFMTRKKKVLITVLCIFTFTIIGGVLYANYWLDNMVADLNSELVTESNPKDNDDHNIVVVNNSENNTKNLEKPSTEDNTNNIEKPSIEDNAEQPSTTQENNEPVQNSSTDSKNQSTDKPKPEEDNNETPPVPSNTEIVGSVQQQVDKPIEKSDLLEAGLIVIRKLSPDEINFMFGFSDNSYTTEELTEVRKVLLSKLNDKDIKTLRSLGQKYGKKLDILDPNVPIR